LTSPLNSPDKNHEAIGDEICNESIFLEQVFDGLYLILNCCIIMVLSMGYRTVYEEADKITGKKPFMIITTLLMLFAILQYSNYFSEWYSVVFTHLTDLMNILAMTFSIYQGH